MVGSNEDLKLIWDYYNEIIEHPYDTLFIFFKNASPLLEAEYAIESLFSDDPYDRVIELYDRAIYFIVNQEIQEFLDKILYDENFLKYLEKDSKTIFYSFVMALLITTMRSNDVDPEELELDEVVNILSEKVNELPSFPILAKFLKKQNRDTVIEFLIEKLNNTRTYWPLNITTM